MKRPFRAGPFDPLPPGTPCPTAPNAQSPDCAGHCPTFGPRRVPPFCLVYFPFFTRLGEIVVQIQPNCRSLCETFPKLPPCLTKRGDPPLGFPSPSPSSSELSVCLSTSQLRSQGPAHSRCSISKGQSDLNLIGQVSLIIPCFFTDETVEAAQLERGRGDLESVSEQSLISAPLAASLWAWGIKCSCSAMAGADLLRCTPQLP